ncbi:MAG: DUF5695 domain-containing protein, partial [Bacteroidales bacterium]|nr:DUF5695 domain-containing protein [Bacteroidales bacterium]
MELISKKTRNELFSIVHFRIIFIYIVFIPFSICTSITAAEKVYPVGMKLAGNHLGISNMIWKGTLNERNYIDEGKFIGELKLKYSNKIVNSNNYKPEVIVQRNDDIQLLFRLPENVVLKEQFKIKNGSLFWTFEIHNKGNHSINIQDLFFPIPIGVMDTKKQAKDNLSLHYSVNGDASFLYWIPYSGEGEILLATPIDGTSLEYFTFSDNNDYYIHSSTSVDRVNETWRMPSSQLDLASGASKTYGFKFQLVQKTDQVRQAIFNEGGIDVRVVPGMTLPENIESLCAIRIKNKIDKVIAEYPDKTSITKMKGHRDGYNIYHFSFKKLGENQITLIYGKNKKAYLEFFITEPLETLIKKRASFIVSHQQIRDTSKWYDGLFGVWDMKNSILLNPDSKGPLPDFVVGGSDDPSNGKALYVSEKNVIYPNEKEIAALEYYEKEFVWGKLQRTDKEYPYPYGIYGSENWYENRSGRAGFYNSGGCGKERMWRTFDYTTHLALYFNLYKIARDYPDMVKYLDMKGYLERAYRTAMAFFEVPYNIKMGEKWSFHGWCDWAYKQGNFHDRYIVDIIQALEQNGKIEEASNLLREWEKKVKYSIYDDPWPFGSEMFVDRTAYETSYYIAEYAKKNRLLPDEQLWYDKNKQSWYSHPVINDSMTD